MVGVEDDFFLVGVLEGLAALDVCVGGCVGVWRYGCGGGGGDYGSGARETGEVAAEYCVPIPVVSILYAPRSKRYQQKSRSTHGSSTQSPQRHLHCVQ